MMSCLAIFFLQFKNRYFDAPGLSDYCCHAAYQCSLIKFSEKDLIQAKIDAGRLLLHVLEKKVEYSITHMKKNLANLEKT